MGGEAALTGGAINGASWDFLAYHRREQRNTVILRACPTGSGSQSFSMSVSSSFVSHAVIQWFRLDGAAVGIVDSYASNTIGSSFAFELATVENGAMLVVVSFYGGAPEIAGFSDNSVVEGIRNASGYRLDAVTERGRVENTTANDTTQVSAISLAPA